MPSTAGFDPGSVARTSGSALTASVEREPRDMPEVLPVARQQRQPLHQRRRGDQGVFLLEIRVPAAQRPVTPRDGGPPANEPGPAQRLRDRSALGAAQALLREQLFPRDDRVVDAAARIVEEPAVSAGGEVVDQDVGVYEDAGRCPTRVPPRKAPAYISCWRGAASDGPITRRRGRGGSPGPPA